MTSQSSELAVASTPAPAPGVQGLQHLVKVARKPASPPPGAEQTRLAPVTPAVRRPRGRPRIHPRPISTGPVAVTEEVREMTTRFVADIAEVIRNAPPAEFLAWVGIDLSRLLSPGQRRQLQLPPGR